MAEMNQLVAAVRGVIEDAQDLTTGEKDDRLRKALQDIGLDPRPTWERGE